ncbi:MAG: hypothetical protein KAT32_00955 [Candidatus Moranbacteria bacterium]|nr:hypothetical protein [Candidatus Moranbacteria bacterium]
MFLEKRENKYPYNIPIEKPEEERDPDDENFPGNIKIENPDDKNPKSINEIFEYRKKFIPEVGKQLKNPTSIDVEVAGEKLNIDYRVVQIESEIDKEENKNQDPVLLLTGFGSGWEGIAELAFSLACEGR